MNLFNKTGSKVLYISIYIFSMLPKCLIYSIFNSLIYINFYLISYRQSVIIQNLSRSFPDKDYKKIINIYKQFNKHLFSLFFENIISFSTSKAASMKKVKFHNIGLLNYYKEQNKPVLLVMGHYGNWENINILPLFVKQPVYGIYKEQRNKLMDNLMIRYRKRFGAHLLESKSAARYILKNKKQVAIYVLIADQYPSRSSEQSHLFLNQQTKAFNGVEKIAKQIEAAVVYVEIQPASQPTFYNISFTDITTSKPITSEFLKMLETSINKAPEYWLWSHRRWKQKL